MSTELQSVKVKTAKWSDADTSTMVDGEITITAFGGQRGRCIQVSINNGVKYNPLFSEHVHLTVDEAIELRKRLTQFIEREY